MTLPTIAAPVMPTSGVAHINVNTASMVSLGTTQTTASTTAAASSPDLRSISSIQPPETKSQDPIQAFVAQMVIRIYFIILKHSRKKLFFHFRNFEIMKT